MGCSSTKTKLKEATPKLTNEKLRYILRNERLEMLASDILDDCLKSSNGTEHGINEIAKEIIRIKSSTNGLNNDDLNLSIKDIYVQQYLFNNHFITEHDLLNEFEEKFLSKTFNSSTSTLNDCYIVLQSMFIQYPQIQNGIHINFSPHTFLEDPCLVQSFYNNLKFNKTFQCELLHFTLNKDTINNNTLTTLSEIIPCNYIFEKIGNLNSGKGFSTIHFSSSKEILYFSLSNIQSTTAYNSATEIPEFLIPEKSRPYASINFSTVGNFLRSISLEFGV